jgi:DNA-binding protein
MSYVLACVTQLNRGASEIVVKARGRAISRAVDVAEVLKNRFLKGVGIEDVKIGTEVITTAEGKDINVSAIEITIGQPELKAEKTKKVTEKPKPKKEKAEKPKKKK